MYHQTTNIPEQLKADFNKSAKGQEQLVKEYFEKHPGIEITRDEIHRALGLECKPDSIGRAMTNLKNAGFLVKTDTHRLGTWGHVQRCYRQS